MGKPHKYMLGPETKPISTETVKGRAGSVLWVPFPPLASLPHPGHITTCSSKFDRLCLVHRVLHREPYVNSHKFEVSLHEEYDGSKRLTLLVQGKRGPC